MLTKEHIERFVKDWFDAWNRHDVEALLSQCAEGAEITSPLVARFLPGSDGTTRGRSGLRTYFEAVIGLRDDLHFESIDCFTGAESLVLHYRGLACLRVAEVVQFDETGKVTKAVSHFSRAVGPPAPKTWRVVAVQGEKKVVSNRTSAA